NPENWSGAFPLIPFFLRNMYLSAYQSYLWNSTLAEWMIVSTAPENLITIEMKQGKLPMIKQVPSEMDIDIPLPSSRYTLEDFAEFQPHLQRVLAREKLELRDIRLKQFREPFFSKGTRPAFYRPKELVQELGWDKMHKGHRKLKLSFCLPRGSYATMLVKRITTAEPWSVQNPTSSTTGSI
ncbi:MAG TPA: tRNA pseudouridine(13) synthase TruD, partial [Gemmatales bacterium]|nr:tRNA pseudouridine(13) synthase TruD [Gemmatales bacterium]